MPRTRLRIPRPQPVVRVPSQDPPPTTTAPRLSASAAQRIVDEVSQARHFRHLAPDVIARVTAIEGPKVPKHADAVDRVKRRLHQIANAYTGALHAPRDAIAAIRAASGDDDALRTLAISLMHGHASTAERLRHLDIVGPSMRRALLDSSSTPPTRIVDLACGLNPLLLPWLGLPRNCPYLAYDVDTRLVGIVGAFLVAWGQAGSADARDIAANPVIGDGAVALLLKSVPCLDQVQPGNARRVLEHLMADRIIVTYPVLALGGSEKGMRGTYRRTFETLVDGLPFDSHDLALPNELGFILTRRSGQAPVVPPS